VALRFLLVHHETGQSIEVGESLAVVANGGRPDDKAEAAAKTMALGYLLRSLLLIPRDDEAAELAIDQRQDTAPEPMQQQDPKAASKPNPIDETSTWLSVLAEYRARARKARRPSDMAEVLADARSVKALPPKLLKEIEDFCHELDEKKRAAAAEG
jgi:pyruvate/2-oxoglutarate dehydrogenase complex dihydrolipoamide acyltransferase (E2) component